MKLFVKDGKKKKAWPFRPTLRIDPGSGFCPNQWQVTFWRQGSFCGAGCVRQVSVQKAIEDYFLELKRMGHVVVTEEEIKEEMECFRQSRFP